MIKCFQRIPIISFKHTSIFCCWIAIAFSIIIVNIQIAYSFTHMLNWWRDGIVSTSDVRENTRFTNIEISLFLLITYFNNHTPLVKRYMFGYPWFSHVYRIFCGRLQFTIGTKVQITAEVKALNIKYRILIITVCSAYTLFCTIRKPINTWCTSTNISGLLFFFTTRKPNVINNMPK